MYWRRNYAVDDLSVIACLLQDISKVYQNIGSKSLVFHPSCIWHCVSMPVECDEGENKRTCTMPTGGYCMYCMHGLLRVVIQCSTVHKCV